MLSNDAGRFDGYDLILVSAEAQLKYSEYCCLSSTGSDGKHGLGLVLVVLPVINVL
jgi:hypothetical protein